MNYDMTAAAFDPAAGSWELLPPVPARFGEGGGGPTVAADGTTITFMSLTVAVLGEGDQWTPLPHDDFPRGTLVTFEDEAAGTERAAVWSIDTEAETNALTVVDLASLAASTQRRQVGTGSVELAEGDVVTLAEYDQTIDPHVDTVRLAVDTAGGGRCTVTSDYLSERVPASEQPVREELPADGGPRTWWHDDAGLVWETEATMSDRFRIACDDATDARRLANSARFPGRDGS